MTKVPPKIQPPPTRVRPKRSEDLRGRKPGQTDEEHPETDLLTMGERLDLDKEALEGHHAWRSLEVTDEELRRREEKHDDKAAQEREERKDQPLVAKKDGRPNLAGDQKRPKTQEELRAEANFRRANSVSDGFEGTVGSAHVKDPQGTQASAKAAPLTALATPPAPPEQGLGGGGFGAAMKFLNDAKEAGHYFRIGRGSSGQQGEDAASQEEAAELAAAVEEAKQLLGGLRGVEQIEGGRDHEDQPVVLVLAGRGFCESSMRAIPEQVHRFKTVVGVAYDLLPLRRI